MSQKPLMWDVGATVYHVINVQFISLKRNRFPFQHSSNGNSSVSYGCSVTASLSMVSPALQVHEARMGCYRGLGLEV
jgi:hypothetical protein